MNTEFIRKALANERGYKFGRSYRIEYIKEGEGERYISLVHYGTTTAKVRISDRKLMAWGGWSISDANSIKQFLSYLKVDGYISFYERGYVLDDAVYNENMTINEEATLNLKVIRIAGELKDKYGLPNRPLKIVRELLIMGENPDDKTEKWEKIKKEWEDRKLLRAI